MGRSRAIAPLALPTWRALPEPAQRAFSAVEEGWRDATRLTPGFLERMQRLEGAPIEDCPRAPSLEHRLSDEFMRRLGPARFSLRSSLETPAAPSALRALESALHAPGGLADVAAAVNRRVCGGDGAIRTSAIESVPDRLGDRVIYPDPAAIRPKLAELQAFVAATWDDRPSFAAAVAMTTIFNVHPFRDGNGRTGRVMFNAVMQRAAGDGYLPLYELAAMSRGGFLLSLREAQYRSDWTPLAEYLQACLSVLAAADAPRGASSRPGVT